MNVISETYNTNNVCHGVGCVLFGKNVGSKYCQNICVQSENIYGQIR